MNRLSFFYIIIFLLCSSFSFSQTGYLFVKKGFKKKRIYTEGDSINVRLKDNGYRSGIITLLRNDTVFIKGRPIPSKDVSVVITDVKRRIPFPDAKTLLLITGGAALTTAGLTLSNQADFREALTAGLIIGYGPLLARYAGIKFFWMIKRKKFMIGKKFRLQVLDFYLPRKR